MHLYFGENAYFILLVIQVIDGLPAEFVLGKGRMTPTKLMMEAMPHTQFLLSKGKAIGFHAKGAPPTVTMPRLKVIYRYLDLILH